METQEIDVQISKNQIAIDFDALDEVQTEEESAVLPSSLVNAKNFEWVGEEVLFLLVRTHDNPFAKVDLCGKNMEEWVLLASSGCESRVIEDGENILSSIKAVQTNKRYIAVFYSDTPLVGKVLFQNIMDYFTRNGLNALTLPRGYVFRRDYLLSMNDYIAPCVHQFDEVAFTPISNARALAGAHKILQDKIRAYHVKNGVVLIGENTISIDCDVEIESGVVIYGGNSLKGSTVVGRGVVLREGNYICDSIISDGCELTGCFISASKIERGKRLAFEKIENSNLG